MKIRIATLWDYRRTGLSLYPCWYANCADSYGNKPRAYRECGSCGEHRDPNSGIRSRTS